MANGRILSTIHLPNFVENGGPVVEIWRGGRGEGEDSLCPRLGLAPRGSSGVWSPGGCAIDSLYDSMYECDGSQSSSVNYHCTASTSALCRALHCTVYR